MLFKYVAVWITTSLILTSAISTENSIDSDSSASPAEERIYAHGGRPVKRGEFPFLALLDILTPEGDSALCSGSIPSPTTVLTSAHCDVGVITAYAGTVNSSETLISNTEAQVNSTGAQTGDASSVQTRYVVSVTKPAFPKFFDIMICYVNQSWQWTDFVAPVALHLNEMSLQPSFVTSCQVMGFGQSKPDGGTGVAYVMDQLIGSSAQCSPLHPILWFFPFWMCSINVGNKTMCLGDSGGPTLCQAGGHAKQWAVNMGVAPTERVCAPPKSANVYVVVAYFRSWVRDNIKDLSSGAGSVRCCLVKILMYKVLPYQPLWLFLLMTVALLYEQ